MSLKVASIVEGDGEVAALPLLLRRVSHWLTPGLDVDILVPIRVSRDRFLNREEELRRHLLLAAAKCGDDGWILILLDADDDCPKEMGATLLKRASLYVPHKPIAVVLANREYEAWFLASAQSLHGKRGLVLTKNDVEVDAERPRDAKGWLSKRIALGRYSEIRDQPAFSALMNLEQAFGGSRSFRKLCSEWKKNMARYS